MQNDYSELQDISWRLQTRVFLILPHSYKNCGLVRTAGSAVSATFGIIEFGDSNFSLSMTMKHF